MIYSKLLKLLPKEVRNLIREDSKWLRLLLIVGGLVGLLIGGELICLYLLGKALLGQSMPIQTDDFFIIRYLNNFSQSQLLVLLGSTFAVVIGLRYGFLLLYNHLSLRWAAVVTSRLQNSMMESILSAPTSEYDKRKLGGIIHGLMEAPAGATFSIDAITAFISNFFTILLIIITLTYISPWMILGGMAIGIPTFWGLAIPLQRRVRHLKNQFIDQRTPSTEMAANVINGIHDIKSLSTESQTATSFSEKVNIAQTAFARARFIKRFPAPTLQTIFQFAFAIVIIITGISMPPENLASYLPSLGVLGYGLFRVYPAITMVMKSRLELYNALPDLEVTDELKKLPHDNLSGGTQKAPKHFNGLRFEGVSFSYSNEMPVVTDLDFSIEAGKITSFVGSSGAGKSTLIDLILKFRSPKKGTIWVGNQNLDDILRKSWLQNLGVVRQDVFLFGGSIRENLLAWNADANQNAMLLACKQSGSLDFINNLPNGLDTIVGDRGVTISGGQRQRLAIARAILRNPDVLILDEALSALDGETETGVLFSLRENSPKRTIILVSHRLASIESSDKIIVLDNGHVVEQGSHADLMAMRGRYTDLFSTQMRQDYS